MSLTEPTRTVLFGTWRTQRVLHRSDYGHHTRWTFTPADADDESRRLGQGCGRTLQLTAARSGGRLVAVGPRDVELVEVGGVDAVERHALHLHVLTPPENPRRLRAAGSQRQHRSWLYKLLAWLRTEDEAGLAPRSRRPHRSPTRINQGIEVEIVVLRKQLSEDGLDAGAVTIHWHPSRRGGDVPSVSTIWRVLARRGFVTRQPKKRPRSSFIRFEASLSNECWQQT